MTNHIWIDSSITSITEEDLVRPWFFHPLLVDYTVPGPCNISGCHQETPKTAFGTSAHRLEIETYRYSKVHVPRNERLCSLCTQDHLIHIGDEFHALMLCKRFKQGRDELLKLFTDNYIQFGSMNLWDKFFYILTYRGSLINQVGKFIYEILSVKRNTPMWHVLTGRIKHQFWNDKCTLMANILKNVVSVVHCTFMHCWFACNVSMF